MTAALSVEAVRRRIGARVVLDGLSLAVEAGECLVLAGESGSGKTTLLRLVAGLDRLDRGRIAIGGTLADDAGATFLPPERRGLGMVFQDFALWPHLSVRENVALALPRGTAGRARRAEALLDRVGVAACASRLPAALSGGQQQRVGIARALAAAPRLLLLDEPFSSLDLETREGLRDELRGLIVETGLTALCVSHDPADAVHLADRVAVLEAGRISQCATPEELFDAPSSPYVARLAGLAGGVGVAATAAGGDACLALDGATLRIAGAGPRLGAARRARLFWPPGAVTQADQGVAAECRFVRFHAGVYRALYRIAGVDGAVPVDSPVRPPTGPAHLAFAADRLRLFPITGDP